MRPPLRPLIAGHYLWVILPLKKNLIRPLQLCPPDLGRKVKQPEVPEEASLFLPLGLGTLPWSEADLPYKTEVAHGFCDESTSSPLDTLGKLLVPNPGHYPQWPPFRELSHHT